MKGNKLEALKKLAEKAKKAETPCPTITGAEIVDSTPNRPAPASRPASLAGLSALEIELLAEAGDLNEEELAWFRTRNLWKRGEIYRPPKPGGWMR